MPDQTPEQPKLKALGESADKNKALYLFEKPNFETLEKFKNPAADPDSRGGIYIDIVAPEFSCLCPMTGQPDTAVIKVKYSPREWCVESKSFKLYLLGYRNFGTFHEACVTQIGNDLVKLLDPHQLILMGEFAARGGIPFHPTFTYARDQKEVKGQSRIVKLS